MPGLVSSTSVKIGRRLLVTSTSPTCDSLHVSDSGDSQEVPLHSCRAIRSEIGNGEHGGMLTFGSKLSIADRVCSIDISSLKSSALKAQVSTTWLPWVLNTRMNWPFSSFVTLPCLAGILIRSLDATMS